MGMEVSKPRWMLLWKQIRRFFTLFLKISPLRAAMGQEPPAATSIGVRSIVILTGLGGEAALIETMLTPQEGTAGIN